MTAPDALLREATADLRRRLLETTLAEWAPVRTAELLAYLDTVDNLAAMPPASAVTIMCLCGDIFPTVEAMDGHIHMVHDGTDFNVDATPPASAAKPDRRGAFQHQPGALCLCAVCDPPASVERNEPTVGTDGSGHRHVRGYCVERGCRIHVRDPRATPPASAPHEQASADPVTATAQKPAPHALDIAWGIIANAVGGDWTRETQEWQEAAARWRDTVYHPYLDALRVAEARDG